MYLIVRMFHTHIYHFRRVCILLMASFRPGSFFGWPCWPSCDGALATIVSLKPPACREVTLHFPKFAKKCLPHSLIRQNFSGPRPPLLGRGYVLATLASTQRYSVSRQGIIQPLKQLSLAFSCKCQWGHSPNCRPTR